MRVPFGARAVGVCEARAPGGSGSAPVGRPLRPSPQSQRRKAGPTGSNHGLVTSKRVPPLGWDRARSLPRALRARAPLLLDSAGCGLCKRPQGQALNFTVSCFGPTTKIQESEVCIGTVSHARIWRHRRSRIDAPPAIDITKTAALVCATIMFRPEPPRPRGKHEPFPPARGAGAECSFGSLAPVSLPRPRDASTSSTSSQISSGPLRSHLRSHLVLSDLLSSTLRSRWRRP